MWLVGLLLVLTSTLPAVGAQGAQTADPLSRSSPSRSTASSSDSGKAIAEHLAIGQALLGQGYYTAAQAEFRAILELDATHREALRLMTKAQQLLEARNAERARAQARLQRQAEEVAVRLARDKASAQARHEVEAKAQLARTREQQLKLFYNRGTELYRQGQFQAAIDVLQQMVLVDPHHPLVREAQRLITRAETKQAETRARAAARLSPQHGNELVSELEQQLTAKKIEIETVLKYARVAIKERNHELAIDLLQRVLVQDPRNRQAQQLLEQEQLAKLKAEQDRLEARVVHDEQTMVNEVVNAQVLPQPKTVQLQPPPAQSLEQAMGTKLRQPISFDFADVPLADVLEFIGDAANVSIIPSPQLDLKTRRVSLKVQELPLELALKYLVKNQVLAYRVEQDAVLISTAEEFSKEPMQTRVFFLRSGLGPFSLETAAIESNPALAMESTKELIEHSVPQPSGSKLLMDQRSGALIATNTSENLELMARLLSQLDVTPVQVLIEARFIELTMTELEQLAVESVLTGNAALTKRDTTDGTAAPSQQVSSGSGEKFPALAREGEGLNLTLQGVLTGLQFETVLHRLEESKKSKTLSAPRVTTLNNQTAQIRVVEEFNYPTRYEVSLIQFDINGDGDFDDAGETEFANVPKDLQKRDIGILLNVTPSVGKDLKTITLVLAPEVSQFSQFRSLGGGVTVPEFTSSQLTTSVVIENGQTVVLGGLMKDTTSQTVTKVPVLGDLPLVGALFRQKETSSTRKNLLIFITAKLLAPRGQTT